MNTRFPLFARILVWLFLNLAVLGLAGLALLRGSFRPESLFMGPLGDRAQQVADTVMAELRERPRTDWNGILDRYRETYGLDFLVYREDREQVAGPVAVLPAEVAERLAIRRRPPLPPGLEGRPESGPGGGPGGGGGPRPGPEGEGRGGPGFRGGPPFPERPPGPGGEPGAFRRGGRGGGGGGFRSYVFAVSNGTHWMMFPLLEGGRGGQGALRLLIRSESLSAGGLFLDPRPALWSVGGVLLFSVLWWLPFVGRITRSLGQMTAATERIAEGRFDVAVDVGRSDELGRLGQAIHRMSGRLEGFVTGQKRFLGDVAHELCTPLARMELALGILDQRADATQREYVQDVRDEVRQMSGLVTELLSFSKAGLRGREAVLAPVELRSLVERVQDRDAAGSELRIEVPEGLWVMAEPELLARAVGNLLRNAVRYAGSAGPIAVRAAAGAGASIEVRVQDEGSGVPESALGRLGEPFFRPDSARTREQGGTGLGLAIVRSCVDACHGTVEFRNRQPRGFEAILRLGSTTAPHQPAEGASTDAIPGSSVTGL